MFLVIDLSALNVQFVFSRVCVWEKLNWVEIIKLDYIRQRGYYRNFAVRAFYHLICVGDRFALGRGYNDHATPGACQTRTKPARIKMRAVHC